MKSSLKTVKCQSCLGGMEIDRQAKAGICGWCFLGMAKSIERKHGVLSTNKRWRYTDSKTPLSPVLAALNPAYRENCRRRVEGRRERGKDLQNVA